MGSKGQWTILIYANGNNELEPEICEAFKSLLSMSIPENINVVVEIGCEDRKIARLLRPEADFKSQDDLWNGVRRYCSKEKRLELYRNMGKINMADPRELEGFIQWGVETFHSEHIVLCVSGHGAAIAGNLSDYSQSMPYIMDTKDLCTSIKQSFAMLSRELDLVIFDMCYMNYVEIAYELSEGNKSQIKGYVTYVDEGPMGGLDLSRLIGTVSQNNNAECIGEDIIKYMREPLVLVNLKHGRLKRIKRMSCELGRLVKQKRNTEGFTYDNLLYCSEIPDVLDLREQLAKVSICYGTNIDDNVPLKLVDFMMEELVEFYEKFSFAQNNEWINVISGNHSPALGNWKKSSPRVINRSALIGLILSSNDGMELDRAIALSNELIKIKGWKV